MMASAFQTSCLCPRQKTVGDGKGGVKHLSPFLSGKQIFPQSSKLTSPYISFTQVMSQASASEKG